MPSSSRSTITASGIATTICSAISSVRSSSGATRSCSPCTSDEQQVGARSTDLLARRSPTRMRPAISLTPAASRLRTGTSLQAAGRSKACDCGSTAAPTRTSSQTRSCRSRPRGSSGISARRPGRGGSWSPPSGLRSTRHPPTGHLRFARHSRTSEAPWLRTASRRCCAMLSSAPHVRRRWAPRGFSAPVAPWVRRTFSWAGRRRQSPCCESHSRFLQTDPSSATLGSSRSAIWSSRPPSWASGETRNDGRSKRAGSQPSNTSTTRSTAPSRTPQERSRTTNAVTRRRPHASSRTSGGCAHCSAWAHGSTPISRCAAPTSASTSATLPAPSNTRRSRATHYRDIPMPERSRPGCSVSKRGSGEDRTTDSHLPSSGSSPFLRTHLSLQDIADRLHLARPTVKTHVASIYGKLGVTCRSDAVEIIEHAGLESTDVKVTIPGPELDGLSRCRIAVG